MTVTNKLRVNFVRRTIPRRGPFDTDDYNASMEELAVDLADIGSRWNTEVYPILNSLPRGTDETRWTGATTVPDPIANGLDGDSVFVDNSATSTTDDGLFWDTTALRPRTIKESHLALDSRVTDIYEELSESIALVSNGLSDEQWNRLGRWVKDGTSSLSTSVHGLATTAKTKAEALVGDVWENTADLGDLQTSGRTIQEMITNLLTIHGGTWNSDTSAIDHSSITGITQDSVDESSVYVKRARGYSPDANDLEDDMNRLRYEIARTRWGSATTESTGQWDSDATDPVDSGVACLNTHVSYQGNGTVSSSNPHALHRQDVTGLDTEFGYTNSFAGKTGLGSEMPTYSSTYIVTQSASLETAIGELDTELNTHESDTDNPHTVTTLQIGAAIREVYTFSSHTDYSTPIIISHGKGTAGIPNAAYPLVQVVDTGVGAGSGGLVDEVYVYEQEHGINTSDAFVSIEYIDSNTLHVYTNLVQGVVIAVF